MSFNTRTRKVWSDLDSLRIILFTKLPVYGKVKTRLSEEIGLEKALLLYQTWVPMLVEYLSRNLPQGVLEVSLAPLDSTSAAAKSDLIERGMKWLPYSCAWSVQEGKDLGERLAFSFDTAFRSGATRVIILGSDSPHLLKRDIEANLASLQDHDLVLGPAEDGGFYAIGIRRTAGLDLRKLLKFFQNIHWSTDRTLQDTLRAAMEMGWQAGLGPWSYDLDRQQDLEKLINADHAMRWESLKKILEM